MPRIPRSHPQIPDHEVLRKIGGGSYGEVWMARSVTGALRAVKVVWREDFDDERTFEREFEGILKYEPISRSHPGLVNILHVGRSNDSEAFYYYVMEIGDDIDTGQLINPVEYEARTLRPDGKNGLSLEINFCIEVGLQLAGALQHLHSHGLAHRDVKPSNIIFVNGKAKLADIGLVAARDQRSYVGTEGFVPPEGPGSAQADIYSLGKVLYEIATGKDRLDFPELPDELPPHAERRYWLGLNRVICEICEPRISHRKIASASELIKALAMIQKGKKYQRSSLSFVWISCLLVALLGAGAYFVGIFDHPLSAPIKNLSFSWFHALKDKKPPTPKQQGRIRIVSSPDGAQVFQEDGTFVGLTPTETLTANVGESVRYIIRKDQFRPLKLNAEISAETVEEPMILFGKLLNFSPPEIGETWQDHLGLSYIPIQNEHISHSFVTQEEWKFFLKETKRDPKTSEIIPYSENGKNECIVLATPCDQDAFIEWFRQKGLNEGYLTQHHEVKSTGDDSFPKALLPEQALANQRLPFRIMIRPYRYGTLQVESEPPGADVYFNGDYAGKTGGNLEISKVKPGETKLTFVLEGYKTLILKQELNPSQVLAIKGTLVKNKGAVFGKAWVNSLGMKFEPIDSSLMVSIWETRIKDYEEFTKDTNRPMPPSSNFEQNPDHPVVSISREDAIEFCAWLTKRERGQDFLSRYHEYRLPTDEEWSRFAGLENEIGDSPSQRDANKTNLYAWGVGWPPPNAVANIADINTTSLSGIRHDRVIPYYDDGHAGTSPVGSFSANDFGLYDLTGNVQEWISDKLEINKNQALGILRGASWNTAVQDHLKLGWRNPTLSQNREPYYGFRVVISRRVKEKD